MGEPPSEYQLTREQKPQSPDEKIRRVKELLEKEGFKIEKRHDVMVVAKEPIDTPQEELDKITDFLRPINYWDLTGHCTQRTAESVFKGVAQYGYGGGGHNSSGVIPNGYHMVSGKTLDSGKFLAFDSVSRAVILSSSSDSKPLAETIVFYADNREEILKMIDTFYGGKFLKEEIADTPYERKCAERKIR